MRRNILEKQKFLKMKEFLKGNSIEGSDGFNNFLKIRFDVLPVKFPL